jgi:uncharacterized protein (TIGR04255 family)
MTSPFPFPVVDPLPRSISPCPILEAIIEIRFVPGRPWDHFPGLFAEKFGDQFPREEDTGIAQLPLAIREKDPQLSFLPYRRFIGEEFTLQVGPRVVGLGTRRGAYPGWAKFAETMVQVMDGISKMRIIREANRVGLRYIDFFDFDIFEQLTLNLFVAENELRTPETGVSTVVFQSPFRQLLQINNSVTVAIGDGSLAKGSVLDIDTSLDEKIPDIFTGGSAIFEKAHAAEKRLFFGLLTPRYLTSLNPQY